MNNFVKEENIEEIGIVKFYKNKRAKRIKIKVSNTGGVSVILPVNFSSRKGEEFVKSNIEWVKKAKLKMKNKFGERIIFDENSNFKTKFCDVKIYPADVKYVLIHLDENLLDIQYPQDMDVKSDEIQDGIKFGIIETLRLEAKDYLPARLKYLYEKYGLKYNRVYIKHQKTRWGSYSSKGNVNLNLELMLLPDELIDFVILHELVHSKFKNHGKGFRDYLNKITNGKMSKLDSELNKRIFLLH